MAEKFFEDTGIAKASPSNVAEFSVSEISGKLKRMVEDAFGRVRVRGEIAGYRGPHSSGHMYFALKDEKARIEAVVWRGVAGKLKHLPEEGMEVIATGKLTTYPGSSKYQIVIDQIEPAGAGALMALLEERKKRLAAEGLFAPERKQLLPYLPMVIGVITSPTGAVIRDILHRIADRFPLHVLVWPVWVQGETSGQEVATAIDGFNAIDAGGPVPRPDVLIVARGGGSIEDLWGFNDEVVVRSAAASMIPLVSAVGHETDWTLIDMAADVRAPTPTGAAEIVVPVRADLEARMATLGARLQSGLQRNLESSRTALRAAARGLPAPDSLFAIQSQRFDTAAAALDRGLVSVIQKKGIAFEKVNGKLGVGLLSAPVDRKKQALVYHRTRLTSAVRGRIEHNAALVARTRLNPAMLASAVANARQRTDYIGRSLDQSRQNRFERLNQRLDQATRLLNSYSHAKTLERGFALMRDDSGQVITRAAAVSTGATYGLEFADGRVDVVAAGKRGSKTLSRAAAGQPKTGKKPSSESDKPGSGKQGDLF